MIPTATSCRAVMFSTSTRIPLEPRSERPSSRARDLFLSFSLFSRLPCRLVINNKPYFKLRHKTKRHTHSNHNPVYGVLGKDHSDAFDLFTRVPLDYFSTTCVRQLEQIPSLPALVSIPFSLFLLFLSPSLTFGR
jgi:hypothetical protein